MNLISCSTKLKRKNDDRSLLASSQNRILLSKLPKNVVFLVKRFYIWATLIYYTQLFNIILTESLTASKIPYEGKTWAKGSLGVLKIVESAGGEFHISGLKALSGHKGPVVYVANHMSLLDTLVLPCILLAFSKVTFVVKEGLLKYPVLGTIIRAIHPIAVTRENPRQDLRTVLNQGLSLISSGCSIIIFPQATRSAIFDETTFNSLGVKLAQRANVPVVPIALKTDFQGNGENHQRYGSCTILARNSILNSGNRCLWKEGDRSYIRKSLHSFQKTLTHGVPGFIRICHKYHRVRRRCPVFPAWGTLIKWIPSSFNVFSSSLVLTPLIFLAFVTP